MQGGPQPFVAFSSRSGSRTILDMAMGDGTWREIMGRTERFLDEVHPFVHPAYLEGWRALALPRDRIPTLDEVNERLQPTRWQIVGVDGYIPTSTYVSLMAHRVFPVARVLRAPEHIDYSPMPDMAHDLIGHLPMLFSAEHREYLRLLAATMLRAVDSPVDRELYEANRWMSHCHAEPTPPEILAEAEKRAEQALERALISPSELTHLGRIYLWTVEFGLLGKRDDFVVYGAGLLSAPREFRSVLERRDTIFPYAVGAVDHDIAFSDLQSRYFVAPDYWALCSVLVEYGERMQEGFRAAKSA
jgi:phenylalanine-4-hydroxylase